MSETFTAYITKYALSGGIRATEVEGLSNEMVKEVGATYATYFHGKDWHRTRGEAVARAEDMRKAKIASLRKQIAKLEKLSFGETP